MFVLFLLVLALVVFLIAGAIALFKWGVDNDERNGALVVAGIAAVAAVAIFVAGSIATIPNGNVAVMVRFGKPTGQVLQSGLSWKSIVDTPVKMSIQTQLFKDDATAASKDLQDVKATIAINYKLDPTQAVTVYRTIGVNYIDVIANPVVQETVKEVTSRYNAEDMILRRSEVKVDITNGLTTRLTARGIVTESVNITNFDFSAEFTAAIEAKVVAAQSVLQAQNKLLQVQVEAQQAKAKAEGDAAAAIARANGQAEANKIVNASLTDTILRYMFIDKMGSDVKVWVVPDSQAFVISPTETPPPTVVPVPAK